MLIFKMKLQASPESYAASVKTIPKHSPKKIFKPELSKVEMGQLVSQVRDLMPDLGDGFIQMCLKYYDNSAELVINALLEENLPPHLIEVDRRLGPPEEKLATTSLRFNIHDGDEFDVNTNDAIDKKKVRLGKKNLSSKCTNSLLNNKSDLEGKLSTSFLQN